MNILTPCIRNINLLILRISDISISSRWKTVNPTVGLIGDKLIENVLGMSVSSQFETRPKLAMIRLKKEKRMERTAE